MQTAEHPPPPAILEESADLLFTVAGRSRLLIETNIATLQSCIRFAQAELAAVDRFMSIVNTAALAKGIDTERLLKTNYVHNQLSSPLMAAAQ